jgi:hypothetical protein
VLKKYRVEAAEIVRRMWTAETLQGVQGTEKHQEIQILKTQYYTEG